MEREGGGARRPPIFPLLSSSSLPLPLSGFPPPPSFFLLCLFGRKWKVKGEQEVRRIHLCAVKFGNGPNFGCPVRELCRGSACGCRWEDVCICALTWRHVRVLHVPPFLRLHLHISTYGTCECICGLSVMDVCV